MAEPLTQLADFLNGSGSAHGAVWRSLVALPFFCLLAWFWYTCMHTSPEPCVLTQPWVWQAGCAGYLLTIAALSIWGDKHRPSTALTRIGIGLAVGIAVALIAYGMGKYGGAWRGPAAALATGAGDPLSPVNAIAATLAVVLAVVTLIATKSAADARNEAERARVDILAAINVRLLAGSVKLISHAQQARSGAPDLYQEADDLAISDPSLARYLSLSASALTRWARLCGNLHDWIMDPSIHSPGEIEARVNSVLIELELLGPAVGQVQAMAGRDQELQLRTDYWQPAAQVIDDLLRASDVPSATANEAMLKIRPVLLTLKQRLLVL